MNDLMNIWNDSPFRMVRDLEKEMGRVFDDYWRGNKQHQEHFLPSLDIDETDNEFLVSVDLPGVSKKDVNIEVNDNVLTISGERKKETREGTKSNGFTERVYGRFVRSFTLPRNVDGGNIKAHYENGVLMLTIPKAASAKSRTIEIEEGKPSFFKKLISEDKNKDRNVA